MRFFWLDFSELGYGVGDQNARADQGVAICRNRSSQKSFARSEKRHQLIFPSNRKSRQHTANHFILSFQFIRPLFLSRFSLETARLCRYVEQAVPLPLFYCESYRVEGERDGPRVQASAKTEARVIFPTERGIPYHYVTFQSRSKAKRLTSDFTLSSPISLSITAANVYLSTHSFGLKLIFHPSSPNH